MKEQKHAVLTPLTGIYFYLNAVLLLVLQWSLGARAYCIGHCTELCWYKFGIMG